MKKRLLLIVPIILLCMMVLVKQTDAGYPTLNLTSDSKTIYAGQKTQLKVGGVKASKIKWTTSNKKVATVSKKGVVTGVAKGKATVKGKYRGVVFSVKFVVKEQAKSYQQLLCKDGNIKIYLKEVKNGEIYLTFVNNGDIDYHLNVEYMSFGGETYYSSTISWEKLFAGQSKTLKLGFYDDNYEEIPYSFDGGKISGQFNYWNFDEEVDEYLKFEKTIK